MKPAPSLALLLAQALASECRDTLRDVASRKEIREHWRALRPDQRRWWLRKARRVLVRWQAVGPQSN